LPYNTTNKKEPILAKNLLPLMKLPSLPELLAYENEAVVHYFCHQHPGYSEKLHHQIEPPGFEHELTTEEPADFLNDCFEYLGADWVSRYFET
jgi:hypothetical protein